MDISEYCQYDVPGLTRLVRDGEVTRRELADCAARGLDRVKQSTLWFINSAF